MLKGFVVALVSASVLVAPSVAGASERDAAQAYADAALRLTQDVKAAMPAVRAAFRTSRADAKRCDVLSPYVARFRDARRLTRRQLRVLVLIANRWGVALYQPLLGPLEQQLAALDSVPTSDPALRTGRALWRSITNLGRLYATYPTDICGQLARWYSGGATGLPLPQVDLRGRDDPDTLGKVGAGVDPDARMERVVARLRELGQGPRRAARFSGDEALEPLAEIFAPKDG